MKYLFIIGLVLWAAVAYATLQSEARVYNESHMGCQLNGTPCEGLEMVAGGLY